MSNYDTFRDSFLRNLTKAIEKWPGDYMVKDPAIVVTKMMPHFGTGGCNIQTPAIRATCEELGIKHTIGAIKEYVNG